MVTERAVMPADLFRAAISGNSDVLLQRLQLLPEELQEMKVTIEASHSASEEINTENQTVQSELQSATRFGDTILHLLVTKGHNELALKVFQRDMSLLKAQNNMLETPLYCAAKVGNENIIRNLIQSDHLVVKGALEVRNKNGETALHVGAKHDHGDIGCMLMTLDSEVAYKVNDDMKSALHIAINKHHTFMVLTMLEVDPTLACTPFSDGMFPVHEAARMGYNDLIEHFIKKYPNDAELQDPYGRNFFHIAAEENWATIFSGVFKDASFREMIERMNTAKNYEGSTPFHIAAEKGHRRIMRSIWENYQVAETVLDKHGYTPLQLSGMQVGRTIKNIDDYDAVKEYVKTEGYKFTRKWFEDVMVPQSSNQWERTQVIGLGSVLITTVAFAAAFTIPGGYNQDHGTPVLGRRYIFRAFILADVLAFIQGSVSLFSLLFTAINRRFSNAIPFATISFVLAQSSMVVAFGLGLHVTLAPVCYPIAVLVIVITLILASPVGLFLIFCTKEFLIARPNSGAFVCQIIASIVVSFLIIFCLAFL